MRFLRPMTLRPRLNQNQFHVVLTTRRASLLLSSCQQSHSRRQRQLRWSSCASRRPPTRSTVTSLLPPNLYTAIRVRWAMGLALHVARCCLPLLLTTWHCPLLTSSESYAVLLSPHPNLRPTIIPLSSPTNPHCITPLLGTLTRPSPFRLPANTPHFLRFASPSAPLHTHHRKRRRRRGRKAQDAVPEDLPDDIFAQVAESQRATTEAEAADLVAAEEEEEEEEKASQKKAPPPRRCVLQPTPCTKTMPLECPVLRAPLRPGRCRNPPL